MPNKNCDRDTDKGCWLGKEIKTLKNKLSLVSVGGKRRIIYTEFTFNLCMELTRPFPTVQRHTPEPAPA